MKFLKQQQGFTIIETLVAVTILMISLAGPLTVAHKGLLASIYARDQVTASYLAQDAVEYLKNIRENNAYKHTQNSAVDWLAGIRPCTPVSPCKVDTLGGDPTLADTDVAGAGISTCTPGSTCTLYNVRTNCGSVICGYTPSTATGGVASQFSRYFYVTPRSGNFDEVQLSVVVDWKNGLVNNQIIYENELFNIVR